MSSSETRGGAPSRGWAGGAAAPRQSRRRALGAAAGLLLGGLALGMGGCGFRPMLATPGDGSPGVAAALEAVYVHRVAHDEEQSTVLAQDLRNALVDRIGQPDRPAYALAIHLHREDSGRGITKDDRVTRKTVTGVASFVLRRVPGTEGADPAVLVSGREVAWSSFDPLEAPFADTMALRRAEGMVAEQLADQIATRVGAWFAAPGAPGAR